LLSRKCMKELQRFRTIFSEGFCPSFTRERTILKACSQVGGVTTLAIQELCEEGDVCEDTAVDSLSALETMHDPFLHTGNVTEVKDAFGCHDFQIILASGHSFIARRELEENIALSCHITDIEFYPRELGPDEEKMDFVGLASSGATTVEEGRNRRQWEIPNSCTIALQSNQGTINPFDCENHKIERKLLKACQEDNIQNVKVLAVQQVAKKNNKNRNKKNHNEEDQEEDQENLPPDDEPETQFPEDIDDKGPDSCKDYTFVLASGHAYTVARDGGMWRNNVGITRLSLQVEIHIKFGALVYSGVGWCRVAR